MTHHLLFLTGTRADFGKLEPLAAAARDAGHRVTFFVTGMHMMDRYGLTRNEVRRMPGVAVQELASRSGNSSTSRKATRRTSSSPAPSPAFPPLPPPPGRIW